MSTHRVVCVMVQSCHDHVTTIGTGESARLPPERVWSVGGVRDALSSGAAFFVVDARSGEERDVRVGACREPACGQAVIRTSASTGEALLELPHCEDEICLNDSARTRSRTERAG